MKILKGHSGITILYKRVASKFVDIRYGVNCGSIDELDEKDWGLCHALEHMFFRGTTARTGEEISRYTRRIGGASNAFTSYAVTHYFINVPKDKFFEGFDIVADCMYNSTFPENWWEVEKGAIITEMHMRDDQPGAVLAEYALENAIGPRAHDIVGKKENILRATVEDLLKFRNLYYTGKNLVLSVAGNVSEKEVLKAVKLFDRWAPGKPKPRQPIISKFNYSPVALSRPGLAQTYISKIKPLSVRTEKQEFALALAGNALASILSEELREKRGLCYGAGCDYFDDLEDHKIVAIGTSVDHEKKAKTVTEMEKTLDRFLKELLTSDRLEESRAFFTRKVLQASDSTAANTTSMVNSYFEKRKGDPIDISVKLLKDTTDSFAIRMAREHLSGKYKLCTMVKKG